MMKLPARDGFTLIELVITMIVIGILAAVAAPKLWGSKARAIEAAVKSDVRGTINAQEVYHGRNLTYASTFSDLGMETSGGVTVTVTYATGLGWAVVGTHPSLGTDECAVRMGDAPLASAPTATEVGVVRCTF